MKLGECIRAAGSPAAGVVLYRLNNWTRYADDGWVVKPRGEWSEDTGLSPDQLTRAFRRLREAGLVEHRKVWRGTLLLGGWRPTEVAESPLPKWQNRQVGGGGIATSALYRRIIVTNVGAQLPKEGLVEEGFGFDGKAAPPRKKGSGKGPALSDGVRAWRVAWNARYRGEAVSGIAESGKWQRMWRAWLNELAAHDGADPLQLIATTVGQWDAFTEEVARRHADRRPARPSFWYLREHTAVAVDMLRRESVPADDSKFKKGVTYEA